jgi:hypothetical protein
MKCSTGGGAFAHSHEHVKYIRSTDMTMATKATQEKVDRLFRAMVKTNYTLKRKNGS